MTDSLFVKVDGCLLKDKQPSIRLNEFVEQPYFDEFPFSILKKQKSTDQPIRYHPEGNVWNHTMLVVDCAAELKHESSDRRSFMWAAFLHDIGKPETTKFRKGKITAYGHDEAGAKLVQDFLSSLTEDKCFIDKVTVLVKYHMQLLYVVKELPYRKITEMTNETDIRELALLGYCDRLGRKNADKKSEKKNIELFLKKCGVKEKLSWLKQE